MFAPTRIIWLFKYRWKLGTVDWYAKCERLTFNLPKADKNQNQAEYSDIKFGLFSAAAYLNLFILTVQVPDCSLTRQDFQMGKFVYFWCNVMMVSPTNELMKKIRKISLIFYSKSPSMVVKLVSKLFKFSCLVSKLWLQVNMPR